MPCGDLESKQREREMNPFPGNENQKVWRRVGERRNNENEMLRATEGRRGGFSSFSLLLLHLIIVMAPLHSYGGKKNKKYK